MGFSGKEHQTLVIPTTILYDKEMIEMIKLGMIFGKHPTRLYSVEWQKHGLPHVHILVW